MIINLGYSQTPHLTGFVLAQILELYSPFFAIIANEFVKYFPWKAPGMFLGLPAPGKGLKSVSVLSFTSGHFEYSQCKFLIQQRQQFRQCT